MGRERVERSSRRLMDNIFSKSLIASDWPCFREGRGFLSRSMANRSRDTSFSAQAGRRRSLGHGTRKSLGRGIHQSHDHGNHNSLSLMLAGTRKLNAEPTGTRSRILESPRCGHLAKARISGVLPSRVGRTRTSAREIGSTDATAIRLISLGEGENSDIAAKPKRPAGIARMGFESRQLDMDCVQP